VPIVSVVGTFYEWMQVVSDDVDLKGVQMKYSVTTRLCCALILLTALAVAVPTQGFAGDHGKGEKLPKKEKHYTDNGKKYREKKYTASPGQPVNVYFTDKHRSVVRSYYREEYKSGHCPPGLAKKHNGCMPPGQEKKWRIGYPVPPDVIVYDLPTTIVYQLGPPPVGHRYVRVASDILMIAVGTGLIVDAIQDLNAL